MVKETELAWAAGFFDGEGYTGVCNGGQRFRPEHCRVLITIVQAGSPALLYRFYRAVGLGHVNGPYRHRTQNPVWSPFWRYEASGRGACLVLKKLWKFLGPIKRDQAKVALEARAQYENNTEKEGHRQ